MAQTFVGARRFGSPRHAQPVSPRRTKGSPRASIAERPSNLRVNSLAPLTARVSVMASIGSTLCSRRVLTDYSSDVGRKEFGFSHEELTDCNAYYEGQFKLFQRSGEGVLRSPETGAQYTGQFQQDRFHGEGENTWADGSKYVGQWRNGQKHGDGRYTSAEDLTYVGQWDNGRRHGKGCQEYKNNDKYEGGWWSGLCSGMGTYYFADGSKYIGVWANGRYDGSGMYYGSDGSRERQWYSNGLLMKREVLTSSSSKNQSRRDMVGGTVLFEQSRSDMHRPALLSKLQPSKHLIQRETGGMDLSVAPLHMTSSASGNVEITDEVLEPEEGANAAPEPVAVLTDASTLDR